jgi:hypothetical protein
MNGANHKICGLSTYPFQIFGNGWEKVIPQPGDFHSKAIRLSETMSGMGMTASSCPA